MAATENTPVPALAEGQPVTVVEYDHLGGVKRTTPGAIHRVGRTIVEVDLSPTPGWTRIARFDRTSGRARDDSNTQFRTDEQLADDQRRRDALAVLARHDLRPMSAHGWPVRDISLDTETLIKIAAVIAEAEAEEA